MNVADKKKVDIGNMRHRITIQSRAIVRDSTGGETTTWTDEATVWASIWPISGRELIQAQQAQSEISTRIRIWYRSDIAARPEWRIKFGNIYYNIESIIDFEERHIYLDLMCVKVL